MEQDTPTVFMVTTGVSHRTKKPFVNVNVGSHDLNAQMSPEMAIELAHNLLAAAEAASTDSFLFWWLNERIGLDEKGAAQMLTEFRYWRDKEGDQP
jgi:hypothetical protein